MRLMESTANGRNQSHSNTRIKQMVKIDLSSKQAVQIKEQQSFNLMQSEECTLALGSHQLQNNIIIPVSPVELKIDSVIIPKISI
jgi:ribosomal protein L28